MTADSTLPRERTWLSWERCALSFVVIAGLAVQGWVVEGTALSVAGAVVAAVAAGYCLIHAVRLRRATTGKGTDAQVLLAVCVLTVATVTVNAIALTGA